MFSNGNKRYSLCGNFNPVLSSGKLTQQLIVDYYCRIEGDRLKYIRNQQSKLRVDTHSGLADALRATANEANVRVRKLVLRLSEVLEIWYRITKMPWK